MKQISGNMTFGQVFFALFTFVFSAFMFFYLGAKFGSSMMGMPEQITKTDFSFLPDEKQAEEIKQLLASQKQDFKFFEVLVDKQPMDYVKPIDDPSEAAVAIELAAIKGEDLFNKEKQNIDIKDVDDESVAVVNDAEAMEGSNDVTTSLESKQQPPAATVLSSAKTGKTDPKPLLPEKKPKPEVAALTDKTTDSVSETNTTNVLDLPDDVSAVINNALGQETKTMEIEPESVSYSLQVGSFSSKAEAEKARALWQKRGYNVLVVTSQIKGKGNWFRLQLGNFPSKADALQGQQQIMTRFKETARVVGMGD